MVMSPIDIEQPDVERHPRFAAATRVECEVREGDVLYLPAFWWHQVASSPSCNASKPRNLAVNYWFAPFWHSEFPCAECAFDVNRRYDAVLDEYHDVLLDTTTTDQAMKTEL
jgi:jumonji domain-containing protein 7